MSTPTPPFELALEPMEQKRPEPPPLQSANDEPLTIDITAEVRRLPPRQTAVAQPTTPSLMLSDVAAGAAQDTGAQLPGSEGDAPTSVSAPAAPAEDRYLAQARREYTAGTIDAPLWTRACAQAGGDEQAALAAYLKSRATALRVLARGRVDARVSRSTTPAAGDTEREQAQQDRAARMKAAPRVSVRTLAIGAVVLVAGAGAALFFVGGDDKPAAQVAIAKPAVPVAVKAPVAVPVPPPAVAQESEEVRLVSRVIELREKGQWNPMVLLATQWTRQSPDDPLAWEALATGYIQLGQWQDAVDAGTTAVRLAPDNAVLWRQLGLAYIEVGRPRQALDALRRSVALNDNDAEAFAQIGLLASDLGELSEARSAFDRALVLVPTDVTSLCGSIAIAERQGRRRDAEPAERQLRGLQAKCPLSDRHPGLATVGSQSPAAVTTSVQAPSRAATGSSARK